GTPWPAALANAEVSRRASASDGSARSNRATAWASLGTQAKWAMRSPVSPQGGSRSGAVRATASGGGSGGGVADVAGALGRHASGSPSTRSRVHLHRVAPMIRGLAAPRDLPRSIAGGRAPPGLRRRRPPAPPSYGPDRSR